MKGQAHFEHIGLLVRDAEKTVEVLKLLPHADDFMIMPALRFEPPIQKVGKNFTLKGAEGSVCGLKLEILEPVPEESEGSYMLGHVEKYGEGLHHIDIDFTDREDLMEMVDKLKAHGGVVVHHNAGEVFENVYTEGIYVEMPAGGLCFELGYVEELDH